jgi:hypothetical protein
VRADLAPFGVDLLLALAGLAILLAAGLVPRRPTAWLAALGLAYLTGAAVVPLVLVALLTIGVPFALETFAVVVLACLAVGVWGWWKRRDEPAPQGTAWWRTPWRSWPADVWIVAAFVLVFGAFALVGLWSAWKMPLGEWDAWSIWARKADMLTGHDTLVTEFWASDSYIWIHQDYPIQIPVWEALHFRARGSFETVALLRHFWLFGVAFVWAVAYLLRERVRPLVWAPLLLLVAAAPGVWDQLLSGYADVPMAIFGSLGAIALALWLGGAGDRHLVLAAIMLAATAGTKNEGLMVAVALLLVAGAVALAEKLPIKRLGIAAAAVAVTILPWRVWTAAHHIEGDMPVLKGLDPTYLLGRTERLWPAIHDVAHEVGEPERWQYLFALAVPVIAAALISGIGRRIAAFYSGALLLAAAGFVWSYWISPNPIDWHLATSAPRVVTALLLISAAALIHLSGLLLNAFLQPRDSVAQSSENL